MIELLAFPIFIIAMIVFVFGFSYLLTTISAIFNPRMSATSNMMVFRAVVAGGVIGLGLILFYLATILLKGIA